MLYLEEVIEIIEGRRNAAQPHGSNAWRHVLLYQGHPAPREAGWRGDQGLSVLVVIEVEVGPSGEPRD